MMKRFFSIRTAILLCASFACLSILTCAQDAPLTAPLTYGQTIERELAGGQSQNYNLTLTAGQFLKLEAQFNGAAGLIIVYGPDQQPLVETSGGDDLSQPKHLALIIPMDGHYRIEVRFPEKNAAAGRYQMLVSEPRVATEADRHYAMAQRAFDEANELFRKGTAESRRQAAVKLRQALPEWRAAGDKRREAETLHSIATIQKMLGESREALPIEQEALAAARASGDRRMEIEVSNGLGTIYSALSEFPMAMETWRQALLLCRELGDRESEVSLLNNLGAISAALGESRQSLDYYHEALSLARQYGYRSREARLLTNIGVRYLNLGEPRKAIENFQQAAPLMQRLGLRDDEAAILHNLAGAWLQLGEYQRALDSGNQALALSRATGYRRVEVAAHILLGEIRQRLGDLALALDHFNQALALSRGAGYRNEEANALNTLGALHHARGELQQALDCLEQAVALHRALGARSILPSDLTQLGAARLEQGEIQQAAENFREAVAISRELGIQRYEVSALVYLGQSQRRLGEPALARESLQRALELSRIINYVHLEAQALGQLAQMALAQEQHREAQTHVEQAIRLIESARASVVSPELRASYRGSSQVFYEVWIESLMRQGATGQFAARAFEASEQSRARGLIELLREARVDLYQDIAPELAARARALRQDLAAKSDQLARVRASDWNREQTIALKGEIARLTAEYDEAWTRVRLASPRYAALTSPEPLKLGEIQSQVLDADTLLLEYSLGERRSYLFAVTPSAIHSFVLPGRKEIEAKARLFYGLLTERGKTGVFRSAAENRQWLARNDQDCAAAALALSRVLIGPAAELLGKKRLLIVGDGILHYIPFAALPFPATAGPGDGEKERKVKAPAVTSSPLIVNHEIITLPSASVLAVLRREMAGRESARKTIAVLADPVFEDRDERMMSRAMPAGAGAAHDKAPDVWAQVRDAAMDSDSDAASALARLPFTRLEAESIVRLVPESERKIALGFDASRVLAASPELGQYRYLHFATHGLLNNTHPELSGLAFSLFDERGQRQNGFLRGVDIYNLRLPAELVVLSGCRTALGREVSGEGLVGLTRAFMYAGAKRVVAGLWKVNDAATAQLMRRFYQEMLGAKRLAPAAALRAAQVSMLQDARWRSPFYWAAFVQQGEW